MINLIKKINKNHQTKNMANQETSINFSHIKTIQSELNGRLLKKLNRSIVFADGQFLEWFNVTLGIDALLRLGGAFNIREFNSFQVY